MKNEKKGAKKAVAKVKSQSPLPSQAHSPVKVKVVQKFSFPEAMDAIIHNKKVRRAEWPEGEHAALINGFLSVYRVKEGESSPRYHAWLVGDGDMLEADWQEA